jgi:chromosome segregation ATPase
VEKLQNACLSLIQFCERESEGKRKYRHSTSILQQERDSLELQLKAFSERPDVISELKKHNLELMEEVESLKSESAKLKKLGEDWTAPAEVLTLRNLVEMKDNTIAEMSDEKQKFMGVLESTRNAAKERIEKLTKSLADETELHRLEVEDLTQKLQGQFTENETLTGIRKRMSETSKAKLGKLRTQKTALKQKVDELQGQTNNYRTRIEELESQLRQITSENSLMIAKLSEFQRQPPKAVTSSQSETVQKLTLELFELRAKEREYIDFQNSIAERDSMIQKLRIQIQSFIKQDNDRTITITELQSQNRQLNENISQLSSGLAMRSSEEFATLEREKAAMESRLRKAQNNDDLLHKNQRLTEMLDRSNQLYVQLKQEHDELRRKMDKTPELSLKKMIVFDWNPSAILRKQKQTKGEVELAQTAYLRRMLLQFFSEEQGNRASLIPVILKLVGCESVQVEAALRQWERGSQLFSGLLGW